MTAARTERRRVALAVLMVVAVGAVFRISSSLVPRLNIDEGWAYYLCGNPFDQVLAYLQKDRHPPLPYALLYLLVGVTDHGEVSLRLPFALLGSLNALLAFLLGRRLAGPRVGLGAAALTAVSYLAWEYDTWMRGYVMLTLFSLASTWCYAEMVAADTRRRLPWAVGYMLSGTLLLYSQYLGFLTLATHAVLTLVPDVQQRWMPVRERLRLNLPCWLGMGLLYAPWLPMLKLQLSGRVSRGDLGATADPQAAGEMLLRLLPLETGLQYGPALFGVTEPRTGLICAAVATFLLLAMLVSGIRHLASETQSRRLLLALAAPPLLFVLLIATRLPELVRVRYYAAYVPYVGMLLAAGWVGAKGAWRHLFTLTALVIAAVNVALLVSYLQGPFFRSADWLTPAQFAARHQSAANLIVGFENHCMHAFNYYYARDQVHYNISDLDRPTYSFSPEYGAQGKLPQYRAWVQEVPQELERRVAGARGVILVLWYDLGSPVRDWFGHHYGVLDGVGVDNHALDGRSETYLLQRMPEARR